MGITDLSRWLKDHDIFEYINLSNEYRHQVIACDIASRLYQYRTTSTCTEDFMAKMKEYIVSFLYAEVHVFFIFDGKAPPEKAETHKERADQFDKDEQRTHLLLEWVNDLSLSDAELRQKIKESNLRLNIENEVENDNVADFLAAGSGDLPVPNEESGESYRDKVRKICDKRLVRLNRVSPEELAMVKGFMDKYEIPWIRAPGEAEAFASYLVKQRPNLFAPAVMSEDTDTLTYGVENWISKYNPSTFVCRRVKLSKILEAFRFESIDQFRDFCVLSECDYNQRLPKFGPTKLFKKWIMPNLDLADFLCQFPESAVEKLRLTRCRELFKYFGQDNEQMPDEILGSYFEDFLSNRSYPDLYWSVKDECQMQQSCNRNTLFFEATEPENIRCKTNWKFLSAK